MVTYPQGSPVEGSLYVEEKLDTKDKYSYFLGGNTPLAILTTEHTDAPKLLVIRDSYSDSMAPFLTAHFSEIHLFDLRYNNMNLPQYIADNDIDAVVVLYSLSNFTTDTNLFKLAIGWRAALPYPPPAADRESMEPRAASLLGTRRVFCLKKPSLTLLTDWFNDVKLLLSLMVVNHSTNREGSS